MKKIIEKCKKLVDKKVKNKKHILKLESKITIKPTSYFKAKEKR